MEYNATMDAFTVPCEELQNLPTLTIELAGQPFRLPPSAWVMPVSSMIPAFPCLLLLY